MSNEKKLLAAGAESVGGDLMLRGVVMGRFRDGDMHLTPEGLAELEVDDVVIKHETKKGKKAAMVQEASGQSSDEGDLNSELDKLGL